MMTIPTMEVHAFTKLCQCFLAGAFIPLSAMAGETGGTIIDPLVINDKSLFLYQYKTEPDSRLAPFFGAGVGEADAFAALGDTRDTSYSSGGEKNWRAGFRYKMGKALSLNFDAKQRDFSTKAMKLNPDDKTGFNVKVKPWAIRLGISYKW